MFTNPLSHGEMKRMQVNMSPRRTRDALIKRLTAIRNLKNIPHLLNKVGKPPGTLLYTGTTEIPTQISLIVYTEKQSEEKTIQSTALLQKEISKEGVNWIRISGLKNTDIVGAIGEIFNIHPLTLEDVLSVDQQPKFENYEHYHFITLKMLEHNTETDMIIPEHFSLIIQGNCVLTFEEKGHKIFTPLVERILTNVGPLRKKGASYLAYRLIDTIVDHYYLSINFLDEQLENQETRLLQNPERDQIHEILHLKKQVLSVRRASEPLRDGLRKILNLDTGLWIEHEKVFISDVFDHVQQVLSSLEMKRETLLSLTDLYMSVVSNKMNEVMKSLTIIATIFIPLTFVAGVYGMNFQHMPELEWKYGYLGVMLIMLLTGIIMYIYMKRRHWF